MEKKPSKSECSMALSLIRTLYIETQPNEGHSNPQGVECRWNSLKEIVSQMAEMIEPGSSLNATILFADQSGLMDGLQF